MAFERFSALRGGVFCFVVEIALGSAAMAMDDEPKNGGRHVGGEGGRHQTEKLTGEQRRLAVDSAVAVLTKSAEELKRTQRIDVASPEFKAIQQLGELRAEAAIPLLIDLIATRDSEFSLQSNEYTPDWLHFPCAVALSKIGEPAVQPLLDRIQNAPLKTTAFQLCCVTLEAILGNDPAEAAVEKRAAERPQNWPAARGEAAKKNIRSGDFLWSATSAEDFRLQ